MSLASISNIENAGASLFFDSKSLKHLESSEVFQHFLSNSAYTTRSKAPEYARPGAHQKKGDFVKNLEDVIEYLDPKKRPVTSHEPKLAAPRKQNEMDSIFCDYSDLLGSGRSYYKANAAGRSTPGFSENQGNKEKVSYSRGFEIPKGVAMDKETRQYIEGLHAKIMGMEKEILRVKRENYDLKMENKKYQDKMVAVTGEQERLEKKKEGYEKKIVSLRENCQNNQEMVNSLKDIMSLQGEEFYEKVVKKDKEQNQEKNKEKEKPSLQSVSIRKARSSIRVNKNYPRSTTSIESIPETPVESATKGKQNRVIVRVNTPRAGSLSSLNSLHLRKMSSTKESVRDEGKGS